MYKNARAWSYDVEELGFRYHMSNLHGAIGVSQIKKIGKIRGSRQSVCKKYYEKLSKIDWLNAPKGEFDNVNPFLYYIRVLNEKTACVVETIKFLPYIIGAVIVEIGIYPLFPKSLINLPSSKLILYKRPLIGK